MLPYIIPLKYIKNISELLICIPLLNYYVILQEEGGCGAIKYEPHIPLDGSN